MKRILLSILVIGILLLSACGASTTGQPPAPSGGTSSTEQQTYILSITVSPSGAGSVSPSSGQYEPSVQVTLTATPASGYIFDCWDGDASGSSATINIIMDSDKSAIAHFTDTIPLAHTLLLTEDDLPGWYKGPGFYGLQYGTHEDFTIDRLPNGEYIVDRVEWSSGELATEPRAFTWAPDTEIAKFMFNEVLVFSDSEKAALFFTKQQNYSLQAAEEYSGVTFGTLAIGEEAFWHKETSMIELYFRVDEVVVRLRYYGEPLKGAELLDKTFIGAVEKVETKVLKWLEG